VWNTVRVAAPAVIDSGRGGVIVLTSYTAAKHGVVGLMRTFANELAEHRIRVNSVHPTGVNTPMVVNDAMDRLFGKYPEMGQAMSNALPVEMVEPVDISNAIVWLASEEARYITGVTLPVDAGATIQ
jgi:NAD(P)-dependent dehydrogenase (short-subunit alcohol dehydrogenase family)